MSLDTIIVAAISLLGTLAGSYFANSKSPLAEGRELKYPTLAWFDDDCSRPSRRGVN